MFIGDILLGSCWDVVVVVELLFPIYIAVFLEGFMKLSLYIFLLYTS